MLGEDLCVIVTSWIERRHNRNDLLTKLLVKGLPSVRRGSKTVCLFFFKLEPHNNRCRKKKLKLDRKKEASLSGECFVPLRIGAFTNTHQSSTEVKQCPFFNVLQHQWTFIIFLL